ncbi:DUF58 domain-containing protein [Leifsonia sp. C5G2]|nr:DUF58 domain-containing protein [Leifsonia sp. C5G2]NUU05506.1 DUF58 domain-containing protein [Leifsonia sp. C5G2]
MLSPALAGAVIVGLVGLVAAFVMSRPEPAFVGAPLLLAAAVAWDRRPPADADGDDDAQPRITVAADETASGSSAAPTVAVRIAATAMRHPDAVQVRLELGGAAPVDAVLTPRAAARIAADVPVVHSGRQRVAAAQARELGADASWASEPAEQAELERVVRPRRRPVRSLPLPARLLGLTGQHVSTRPGDGGEFRDVDLFHPGDRLRRIDWRATARAGRAGELYVRRTTATSDAAVHLVVDARDDVSGVVADWSRAYPRPALSSLDVAREAAASLAAAYAAAGDRVGFDDLGGAQRVLPPRAGARHRERVLRAIDLTTATGTLYQRVRSPRLSPGALVFVLSTFLDDQPITLALTWRAAGHRVIAVDVLPARDARDLSARERLALRTVELERRLRLQQLQSGGVELMPWADVPAREAALRALTGGGRRR